MSWLLDTCCVSELWKPKPDIQVQQWIDSNPEEELFLSVLTLGELHRGIQRVNDPKRRHYLQKQVGLLESYFEFRILPVTLEIAIQWGQLTARLHQKGLPNPPIDALIAATAQAHRLTLVTRNVADFSSIAVPLFNPWE